MASENAMKELKEQIRKWKPLGFKQPLAVFQPPIKIKSVFLVFSLVSFLFYKYDNFNPKFSYKKPFVVFSIIILLSSLTIFPTIEPVYAEDLKAFMVNGAGGVTWNGASGDDITWTDATPDEYDTDTFTWTTGNSYIEVDSAGFYRVMYGTATSTTLNDREYFIYNIEIDSDGGNNSWSDS